MKAWYGILAALLVAASVVSAPAEEDHGDTFIKNGRQLTYEGKRSGESYFSPDGKNLIFQSEREKDNPFYQIYILSLETGDINRVSPGTGKTTCSFFQPGSDRVLFASTHGDPDAVQKQKDELEFRASGKERRYSWDYDDTFDIYSADRDGSDLVQLTNAKGYDAEGGYSPDGKQIVFSSTRSAYPVDQLSAEDREQVEMNPSYFAEIYIMDADGSNQKRLTDWPGYDGGPFFTPDGEHIVWRHFTTDGALADVYTMKLDGSERHRVTNFGSMCWAPFYHPSGEYIIFTSNKLGFSNFELYIVAPDGRTEPVRVTYTDGFDGLPVFSPDGKRIVWTSTRTSTNKSQVFIGDWNHEAALEAIHAAPLRELSDDEAHGGEPGHRDGEMLASLDNVAREAVAGYSASEGDDDTGGFSSDIRAADMRAMVGYLASDELEGRLTGSKGEKAAREYIARYFKDLGLEPLGDKGGYFQEFPFTSGIKVVEKKCHLAVTIDGETSEFEVTKEFSPLAFTDNATVEGEVVFAGFGLTMPGNEDSYDSYAGLDVKDKIVLVLRYVPEDVEMERRQELNMYAGLRYKATIARENGAKGLLIAIGPNSPNAGELVPVGFDQSLASSGIPVASITGDVAAAMFKNAESTLQEAQDGLDVENPHAPGHFALPGVTVKLTTTVEREKDRGHNVIAYIPPGNDDDKAPVFVIGAHYDHLGHGAVGSLADKEHITEIHNGADDNASGTATMMELAAALKARRDAEPDKFRYGVVLAGWSGEEMGIIGSSYFADNPSFDWDRAAGYMNFDMVGRVRDNQLMIRGVGSSDVWTGILEKRNVVTGFNLDLNKDPYLPTDVVSFYPKKLPVIDFFTGSHEDYHKPSDDVERINFEDMERVGKLAFAVAMDIVGREDRPQWAEVERTDTGGAGREMLRAYLGTIPDYAGGDDIVGVKLSGVRAGGPADKAGIQGGDIIVEFGGKEIQNIYDYTYALDAVKVGEPVKVVVLRGEERVELTVTPEARK